MPAAAPIPAAPKGAKSATRSVWNAVNAIAENITSTPSLINTMTVFTFADRDVVIVEDIIDSGLTLSWLMRNLATRSPRSLSVCTLLRKPDAVRADLNVADIGFDIPNDFVVGYGLDYAERYRDLPYIGRLKPSVYQG